MSTAARDFRLTPMETILAAVVCLGMIYMVYLFGFGAASDESGDQTPRGEVARAHMASLVDRQAELDAQVKAIRERLAAIPNQPPSEELVALRGEVARLTETLSLIDARLGEITRLLPPVKRGNP